MGGDDSDDDQFRNRPGHPQNFPQNQNEMAQMAVLMALRNEDLRGILAERGGVAPARCRKAEL
eukprot:7428495-Alexandrium_andersonii.AAC.1